MLYDGSDPETVSGAKAAVREVLAGTPSEWLTPIEAAAYLRLHPETLQKWRTMNKGPPFYSPAPRMIRYRRVDLDAYLIVSKKACK